MAASLALPLKPLVILLVVVAAGAVVVVDASGEESSVQSAEILCAKTVDPDRCKTVVPVIPGITMERNEALFAEMSLYYAAGVAIEAKKMAYDATSLLSYSGANKDDALKHSCLVSCTKTVDLLHLILSPAEPRDGGTPFRLQKETILNIHRNLTGLFRSGEVPPPPCVSSACPDKSCSPSEVQVVEYMKNVWSLLDFIQIFLDQLCPPKEATSYQQKPAAAPAVVVAAKYGAT
ncbi:hypothetical protein GUJ93_ZPchr0011g27192 [Zizania palustris]|uniref:Pectinesterase inhibitor domain-containing protein n=1 Tax=Zizania palustris TaxID=103762 RepID=A0A8J5WLE6_ZIZPA|nr:hypothetical protein GUJ93_ZPchr0011g27192 [Zizania palustris]